jgi:cytochrome b subunit of formate dehydrogenase
MMPAAELSGFVLDPAPKYSRGAPSFAAFFAEKGGKEASLDSSRGLGFRVALVLALLAACFAAGARAQTSSKPSNDECLACHTNGIAATMATVSRPLDVDRGKLTRSVHGGTLACVDCHRDITSLPHPSTLKKVGCSTCHAVTHRAWAGSVHARIVQHGPAATCQDCHGEAHSIAAVEDIGSPVNRRNLDATCGRCHYGDLKTNSGSPSAPRIAIGQQGAHGHVMGAAVCTDCHGAHAILPAGDPRSAVNRANLPATCGQCHRDTSRLVFQRVHADPSGLRATHWVRWIYLILIVLVIGGMALHNAILWRSKARAHRAVQNPYLVRMTVQQRWQHLALLTSFFVLAATGFALKYPDSWLAHLLPMSELARSIVHRAAGVLLISVGLYHIYYVFSTREGHKLERDLMPARKDFGDLFQAMRYHLGLGGQKPKFGRFSYAEKVEYWALVWGAALMGLTGLLLWARAWVESALARWLADVALAVHFYEAVLATLAIFVWHFYQVFLDPDVSPMNWAWFDGKMSVEHYKREHELDTESIAQAESKDSDPPPQN